MKKYTDVDIVAELQKLVDSHVDSYKEDFDIDKRIIRRAAESRNPEEKTLMWFCRPHGTHCLNENQVFIQGTRDHNTFRFYAEQTYDECIARVIIPKAVKRGKVFGDVFEINYREQAANVAQNAVAPDHDRLTFADGFVLDAPAAAASMQQWLWSVSMAASKPTRRSRRTRMLWWKCCPSRKAAVTDCRRQKGQRRFRLCPLQNSEV